MYAVIPGKAKPSKSLSTDQTRPVLTHAELRETNGVWEILASDSYQLARVRLDVVEDNSGVDLAAGPISTEALKAIEKSRAFQANGTINPCDRGGTPTGQSFARPDVGQFPNWDAVVPVPPAELDTLLLGLDPKLLWALSQALGAEKKLVLRIDTSAMTGRGNRRAIAVGTDTLEFPGLLMPVRID